MPAYHVPSLEAFADWIDEVLLEANVLSGCDPATMRDYWKVEGHADLSEATKEQQRAIASMGVGVAHKNGWLAGYGMRATSSTSARRHWESYLGSFGFIEMEKLPTSFSTAASCAYNWQPVSEDEVDTIFRNVFEKDPVTDADDELVDAMLDSIDDFNTTCVAVGSRKGSKSTGLICFRRDLRVLPDRAVLDIAIVGFHCRGTEVQRASLIAALFNQMVIDIETCHLSLLRGGIPLPLHPVVRLSDGVGLSQGVADELLEQAMCASFDQEMGTIPDWCDLEHWCKGVDAWRNAR